MREMPSNQVAKPSEQQECQNPVNRAQLSGSSLTRNPRAVAPRELSASDLGPAQLIERSMDDAGPPRSTFRLTLAD